MGAGRRVTRRYGRCRRFAGFGLTACLQPVRRCPATTTIYPALRTRSGSPTATGSLKSENKSTAPGTKKRKAGGAGLSLTSLARRVRALPSAIGPNRGCRVRRVLRANSCRGIGCLIRANRCRGISSLLRTNPRSGVRRVFCANRGGGIRSLFRANRCGGVRGLLRADRGGGVCGLLRADRGRGVRGLRRADRGRRVAPGSWPSCLPMPQTHC